MRGALLLLLLISLSFATHLWEYGTDGPVSAKPVGYQNMVIVASDDGSIYALDAATGVRRWETAVGAEPNEVFLFDNSIITSTTSSKVMKLDREGKIVWTADLKGLYNSSYVYGAAANQKYIFVSANNGIYTIEKNGSIHSQLVSFTDSTVTPPGVGTDYVVYGKGNQIFKVRETGQREWTRNISEGSFWTSRPVIDSGVIYVGALDDSMHAFAVSGGYEIWKTTTRGWVAGTPLVKNGAVYFGSNDGSVYSVESSSGRILWSTQTQLGIATGPEAGIMGGRNVIFVGGGDRSVYAMEQTSGDIIWKGSAAGAVGSPLFYQNSVIFGSQDNRIYAHATERACSITSPVEGEMIGFKEVKVRGKYISEAGGATVWISINGGQWEEAELIDDNWTYYLNPAEKFNAGLNTISCRGADSGGEEAGDKYTTVAITHDRNIPLSDFVVTVSNDLTEGEPFSVYVNDGDDGSPVERFTLIIDGSEYAGDRNVTLTMAQAGSYTATIRKIGFDDATVTINVNASGISPMLLVGAALAIIIIVWQVWSRFLKQRFAKK